MYNEDPGSDGLDPGWFFYQDSHQVMVVIVSASLVSVEFTSDHGLLKKNPTSGSVWGDSNVAFESPEWVNGVRNNPISQTKDTLLAGLVSIIVQPAGVHFELTGYGWAGSPYFQTAGGISTGQPQVVNFTSTFKLPDFVCIWTATIDWKLTVGTTQEDLGNSGPHKIYVTYGTPALRGCNRETD